MQRYSLFVHFSKLNGMGLLIKSQTHLPRDMIPILPLQIVYRDVLLIVILGIPFSQAALVRANCHRHRKRHQETRGI